ncbi:caspase activity and apoptosis inhibitor 1 isoform X1 [Salvelinus sp. IW2-2015]|uniref:caspase activity and apoptosis inhibitor 1 isoform X1 n=1 Tax=Salvelinus sp. IW2-2015 TaxID=2691554 RepID=UPI000CEABF2F|nr:caspase activity and apoptosis inhibitor 1 isoform X1 [Salvelinus alpinus]
MLRKKSTSREKKRKSSHTEEQHVDRRRRCTESSVEESKDEQADLEPIEPGSDVEEGGLDLSVPFKPISAYVADRHEMLDQCFHVLGESKLQKMLPDELKSCSLDEIKTLCREQLEQLSQSHLLHILEGEELTGSSEGDRENGATDSQQDNNVDSTSSLKESVEVETKQEGGGSEESDVLSINADTYDSDIEGHKDEPSEKTEEAARTLEVVAGETSNPGPSATPAPADGKPFADKPPEPKKELQKDIDKSVSEILALASTPDQEDAKKLMAPPLAAAPEAPLLITRLPAQSAPVPGPAPAPSQPSAQQLELLELEMRARAIKALMKANDVKKQT